MEEGAPWPLPPPGGGWRSGDSSGGSGCPWNLCLSKPHYLPPSKPTSAAKPLTLQGLPAFPLLSSTSKLSSSTATSSRKPSWVSSPYQEGILFLPAPPHSAWVAARTTTITHEACTLLLEGSRQRGSTPTVESHQSRPQTQGSEPINLG